MGIIDEDTENLRRSRVMQEAMRHWRAHLRSKTVLDPDQAQRVRDLRTEAHSPADIARRLAVPVEQVRQLLADEGLLDRRPALDFEPLRDRPAVARDLLSAVEARQHLGIGADTLRRWVLERHLPYRDALGRVTADPYSARWCSFSRSELDRWIHGLRC